MKACQLTTTFYFAAVNDKTVTETLRALQTQTAVAEFIAAHQGADPATLQRKFIEFAAAPEIEAALRAPARSRLYPPADRMASMR